MNPILEARFKDAYHKVYGIHPELEWDGTFYRSAHLPMPMSPRRLLSHIITRLESRISA